MSTIFSVVLPPAPPAVVLSVQAAAPSWVNETKDIKDRLATIEEHLLILVPDPQKIEQYEALKIAYEHYKTLENLLK